MVELIHTFSKQVTDEAGTAYRARVYGEQRADGTWAGWLEFAPGSAPAGCLLTGQETSQPDRKALEYWASGLEPVYLDGALTRALGNARAAG